VNYGAVAPPNFSQASFLKQINSEQNMKNLFRLCELGKVISLVLILRFSIELSA